MKILEISSNAHSGSLASSTDLIELPSLESITLRANNFSGIIPSLSLMLLSFPFEIWEKTLSEDLLPTL